MGAWFRYFLMKAISQRRGRFILSASAVMLSVAVVTALITLSLGVRDKLGAELRQYGANMIVTRNDGGLLAPDVAEGIRTLSPHIKEAAFQLYGTVLIGQAAVEVIGMDPLRTIGMRLYGDPPRSDGELMVGVGLKDALKVKQGDKLRFDRQGEAFAVSALFEKGSEEDAALVVPIAGARKLLGVSGVSAVLLNADTAFLREVESALRGRHPFLEVKTHRQVAVAEERILGKIQLLMLMVTGVVLFSSAVALGSTMGANVIERMGEIGLMKAVGATPGDIRGFFMSEAALAGFAGSLGGCLAGIAAAEAVSQTAFGSSVPVSILVVPGAFVLGISIALLSTYFPVRDAMKVAPAMILRGE